MNENPSSTELAIIIPNGEIVSLKDTTQIARALQTLRNLEQEIRDCKTELTHALVEHSQQQGTKTLTLPDGHQAIIKSGTETTYDAETIMEALRDAGMPEHRINQIIKETVTYTVNAIEAKKAANANPTYAKIIQDNSQTTEKRPSIQIK